MEWEKTGREAGGGACARGSIWEGRIRGWDEGRIECKITYEGPNSLILKLASHCPRSIDSSSDLPSTMPARKPPAKASLQ